MLWAEIFPGADKHVVYFEREARRPSGVAVRAAPERSPGLLPASAGRLGGRTLRHTATLMATCFRSTQLAPAPFTLLADTDGSVSHP